MKPITSTCLRNFLLMSGLLLLAGAINIQAATTYLNTASGNWSDATKWNPATGFPSVAGDVARPNAGGFSVALTGPITAGQVYDSLGSAGGWTVTGTGPITMDNTGDVNNPAANADSFIGNTSSGTIRF